MRMFLLAAAATLPLAPLAAQSTTTNRTTSSEPSLTLYSLPAYVGRGTTVSEEASNLYGTGAQSARVVGEWEVCDQPNFRGNCRTISSDMPLAGSMRIASARPAESRYDRDDRYSRNDRDDRYGRDRNGRDRDGRDRDGRYQGVGGPVDIEGMDVDEGVDGQDVSFFARPAFQGNQVAAGTNSMTSASAFCRQAGFTSAAFASQGRTQTSNLIDVSRSTRTRGYALRDVLCRR